MNTDTQDGKEGQRAVCQAAEETRRMGITCSALSSGAVAAALLQVLLLLVCAPASTPTSTIQQSRTCSNAAPRCRRATVHTGCTMTN